MPMLVVLPLPAVRPGAMTEATVRCCCLGTEPYSIPAASVVRNGTCRNFCNFVIFNFFIFQANSVRKFANFAKKHKTKIEKKGLMVLGKQYQYDAHRGSGIGRE